MWTKAPTEKEETKDTQPDHPEEENGQESDEEGEEEEPKETDEGWILVMTISRLLLTTLWRGTRETGQTAGRTEALSTGRSSSELARARRSLQLLSEEDHVIDLIISSFRGISRM